MLSFLLEPIVCRFERMRLPRIASVVLTVVLVGSATAGLGWVMAGQFTAVVEELPRHKRNLEEKFEGLRNAVARPIVRAGETMKDLREGLAPETQPATDSIKVDVAEKSEELAWVGRSMETLLGLLGALGVVALLTMVLLVKRDDLRERFIRLAGGGKIYLTTRAMDEASRKVSRYLLMQTLVNSMHGVLVTLGLWALGVPSALLWGLFAAVLRFIPYVGPWISAGFPILMSLAVSPGWKEPAMVIGLFLLLELITNNLLEPWLYGSGTGVSAAAILIAVVFWTWLWGPVGLVLATPLTVCLAVAGKYVPGLGFLDVMLDEKPVLKPEARLYERLVGGDPAGAWQIVDAVRDKPPAEVFDATLLPALHLAALDRELGDNDGEETPRFLEAVRELADDVALRAAAASNGDAAAHAVRPSVDDAAAQFRVACLPARDPLDEAACLMYAHALAAHGVAGDVFSSDQLPNAMVERVSTQDYALVLVSDACASAASTRRVEYFLRRLAARAPGAPVVVGLWHAPEELDAFRGRLKLDGRVAFVSTLVKAVEHTLPLRGLDRPATAAREALGPPTRAGVDAPTTREDQAESKAHSDAGASARRRGEATTPRPSEPTARRKGPPRGAGGKTGTSESR